MVLSPISRNITLATSINITYININKPGKQCNKNYPHKSKSLVLGVLSSGHKNQEVFMTAMFWDKCFLKGLYGCSEVML